MGFVQRLKMPESGFEIARGIIDAEEGQEHRHQVES